MADCGRSDVPIRVLVVEDELLVAIDLESRLEDLGCEIVGTVARAEQAAQVIREENPDAAVLDVRLQDGTSEPVADLLVKRERPFVFVTANHDPESLKAKFPRTRVLSKPVSDDELAAALELMKSQRT